MSKFYSVLGNRDHLKVKDADGNIINKKPITEFIEGHDHWLTSLVYMKGMCIPEGKRFIDCGAWSYKDKEFPKWNSQDCLEQYNIYANEGDIVAAPDHMVLRKHDDVEQKRRLNITLKNAKEFLAYCPSKFKPIAVTHGNDLESRKKITYELLEMGYKYIAIGGVAGRAGNRKLITSFLEETIKFREQEEFYIHVLGISALSWIPIYRELKIDSYDGSAMFYAAFTGATYYYFQEGKIKKFSVKDLSKEEIPICNCLACVAMRNQGDDTRTMGCNERNMGRAVHNINTYLRALREIDG